MAALFTVMRLAKDQDWTNGWLKTSAAASSREKLRNEFVNSFGMKLKRIEPARL